MSPWTNTSPWRLGQAAQPLCWWAVSQLEDLAARLDTELGEWRQAWGLPPADAVACTPAGRKPAANDRWQPLGGEGARAAWLQVCDDAPARLQQALFPGARHTGAIASELARLCRQDGLQRVASALALEAPSGLPAWPPTDAWRMASGAVHVGLPAALGGMLLISREAMRTWCQHQGLLKTSSPAPSRDPLADVAQALQGRSVRLQVTLNGCELQLGSLQGLQAGDVLRLSSSLSRSAQVADEDGRVLFSGFLGVQAGRKVVELSGPSGH